MNQSNPGANAAAEFPAAAGANRSVFYHSDGSAKSIHEVYSWATKQTDSDKISADYSAPSHSTASSYSTSYANDDSVSNDWSAMQLYAGDDASPLLPNLPSAPFVLTPGLLHLLSSMTPDNSDKSSSSLFN
jgi:hypothetical protein